RADAEVLPERPVAVDADGASQEEAVAPAELLLGIEADRCVREEVLPARDDGGARYRFHTQRWELRAGRAQGVSVSPIQLRAQRGGRRRAPRQRHSSGCVVVERDVAAVAAGVVYVALQHAGG